MNSVCKKRTLSNAKNNFFLIFHLPAYQRRSRDNRDLLQAQPCKIFSLPAASADCIERDIAPNFPTRTNHLHFCLQHKFLFKHWFNENLQRQGKRNWFDVNVIIQANTNLQKCLATAPNCPN